MRKGSSDGGRKKGHANRHTTCGKVCQRSRIKVGVGRVYVPNLPPGIRRAGERLLRGEV
jgi:hypothetical protein